jgi:hypothetical protein
MFTMVLIIMLFGILSVLFFVMISYYPHHQSSYNTRFIAYFNRLVNAHNLQLSKTHFANDAIIGLDIEENKLLVVEKTAAGKPKATIVSRDELQSSTVMWHYRSIQIFENKHKKNVKKIVLRLVLSNGLTKEIDFYNRELHGVKKVHMLAFRARSWEQILSRSTQGNDAFS